MFVRLPWDTTEARRNLVRNPRMRTSTDWSAGNGATFSPIAAYGILEWTASAPAHSRVLWNTTIANRGLASQATGSMAIRVPAASPPMRITLRLQAYSDGTAGGHSAATFDLTPNAPFERFYTPTYQFQPGEDGMRIRVGAELTAGGTIPAGTRVFLIEAMLERTWQELPYFDGSFEDEIAVRYDWVGAENNSESVIRIPSPADRVIPDLPVTVPFESARQARSLGYDVLESAAVVPVLLPATSRTGTFEAVFANPTEALAAQDWFSTMHEYAFAQDGAPHKNMRFIVAGGQIECELIETGAALLRIPFKELPS